MRFAKLAAGLAAAAFGVVLAVSAQAETTMTFAGSDAVGSLLDRQNKMFTKLVNERAKGELKINFIEGEALGSDVQVIEQMMQNSVQLYGDVVGWYNNWVKDFAILNWGFTFKDKAQVERFFKSDVYRKLADQLQKEHDIRILAAAPTQPHDLFAKKKVGTPADLAGLKMRVPEIRTYLLLWETLGTKPSRVTWGEVFLGLKTGVIEAAEGPVSAAYAAKFYQAAPFVMKTDHLISTTHIAINEKAYESLSPELRKIVTEAAQEAVGWASNEANSETEELYRKMAAEGATIVPVDTAPFAEKARAGVEKMEADGVWSKGLWEQIHNL
ncbi:TRAP-type C4-dicarboxylate transport system, substrate-binding protein [Tistlia consotensis]|uniref:TRAP-type C4-dicarboxylate transport system, substrate-binding protein n=1 Tax=Tistlia consotensis USBA 355 TaxID=560819 RepID=A0A1Y6BDM6_9PROT|nr:TRAP transporter substrate-binding protein [Tistlia consotensis]SME98138.1 TRAP-type C4-dicarboxylate transport system, substrate-binding protein [Tistlia consotensis USBA 355]SNR57532.1 TRAP-type C4-dicarboxylate transport system, substrate-binding protein [Tistlia consotensis]